MFKDRAKRRRKKGKAMARKLTDRVKFKGQTIHDVRVAIRLKLLIRYLSKCEAQILHLKE